MWRKIVAPEILYAIGGLQAISPYLWWVLIGKNPDYIYQASYIPIIFWLTGYVAFWFGCKPILPRRKTVALERETSITDDAYMWNWKWTLFGLVTILGVQSYYVFLLYGGIPLLLFVTGRSTVFDINELQVTSGFGQLGALLLTLFALQAVLLVIAVKSAVTRRPQPILVVLLFFLILFMHVSAGKRQGAVMLLVFLAVGLSIANGNPIQAMLSAIGIRPRRSVAIALVVTVGIALVALIEGLGSLRVGDDIAEVGAESRPTIVRYLELPLINLEGQIELVGMGPAKWEPTALLNGFIPAKWQDQFLPETIKPVLPEPTSPTGFFGPLQWSVGLMGSIVFCFLAGVVCNWLYRRARDSLTALLCYSQVAWALLAAHSYNHFLVLLFFVAPAILYGFLATSVRFSGRPKTLIIDRTVDEAGIRI